MLREWYRVLKPEGILRLAVPNFAAACEIYSELSSVDKIEIIKGLVCGGQKDKYDYHKYRGKVRATNAAFYKRKDRFWFEKFARQKDDKEIEEFFVSNFIYTTDPGTMWIGEMIRKVREDIKSGKRKLNQWVMRYSMQLATH